MSLVDFDYAVVRFVPSACREEFRNVGVILHAPAADYLDARFRDDVDDWCTNVDVERIRRYLSSLRDVARGATDGGPLAALARSERFHWLTAPRSDSLQASPRHPGRAPSDQLEAALNRIFEHEVARTNS